MPYAPKVVSIFSGCGGLDWGFHEEGYETIWANDFAEWAVKSFAANFGDVIKYADITKIDPYKDKSIPDCDIVLGGFPCQDFSIIWKQPGLNGTRGGLFRHFAEFVDAKKPKAFVAENVKGLITAIRPVLKARKRVTITSLRGGIPSLKNCRHNLPTTAANCHNKLLTLHVETVVQLSQ